MDSGDVFFECDVFNEQPEQLLAFLIRCCLSVPQRWQILCKVKNLLVLVGC